MDGMLTGDEIVEATQPILDKAFAAGGKASWEHVETDCQFAIARAAARKVVEWAEQWAREYEPDGFGQLRAVRQFAEALRQEVGL